MSHRPPLLLGLVLLLAVASLCPARPHEGSTVRHAALDEAIREEPDEGVLYLQRAELLAVEGAWPAAFRDLERAEGLGVAAGELARARALLYRGLGCHRWAHDELLRLEDVPQDDALLLLRAELGVLAGRPSRAEQDYTAFLASSALANPDHVLALAALLEGQAERGPAAALAVIEAGRARLGNAPAFDLRAQGLRARLDSITTSSSPAR